MPVIASWNGAPPDVVVIGAGAAGLAAARRLMATPGLSVLVIEAGSRRGGRAHTVVTQPDTLPLDLGCGWLHSALTNVFTHLAEPHGFTVDRRPAPWNSGDFHFGASPDELADFETIEADFERRIADLVASGRDEALGKLIAPDHRWRGLLDAVSTYVSGTELDHVSAVDHERYKPGEGDDWRVVEGYGSLVTAVGRDVPVILDTAATAVDHSGKDTVRIDTGRGSLTARAVIVTVSTDVLAGGSIVFSPALPEKLAAAADLPLGIADKLFLRLDNADDYPPDGYRLGTARRAETGAYHIRPFGRPVIEGFYGGQLARDLEHGGIEAFTAFAQEELAGVFGSAIVPRLKPIAASAWAQDPHSLGSYSYAVPGKADSRAILADPVDQRLFFAGEATSPHRFTTAHGAYESGITAAEAVIKTFDASSAAFSM